MTNYGKTVYHRVGDIEFIDMSTVLLPDKNINLIEYYQKQYNIAIKQPKQPLIKPGTPKR